MTGLVGFRLIFNPEIDMQNVHYFFPLGRVSFHFEVMRNKNLIVVA